MPVPRRADDVTQSKGQHSGIRSNVSHARMKRHGTGYFIVVECRADGREI